MERVRIGQMLWYWPAAMDARQPASGGAFMTVLDANLPMAALVAFVPRVPTAGAALQLVVTDHAGRHFQRDAMMAPCRSRQPGTCTLTDVQAEDEAIRAAVVHCHTVQIDGPVTITGKPA